MAPEEVVVMRDDLKNLVLIGTFLIICLGNFTVRLTSIDWSFAYIACVVFFLWFSMTYLPISKKEVISLLIFSLIFGFLIPSILIWFFVWLFGQ
jgi:ABC-type enterochelin transport system permease subunit